MTEPKFTPGPWEVRYGDQIFAGEDHNLADVWTELAQVTCQESAANAHLIAAAPDLYTALDALIDGRNWTMSTERFIAARAALAKARGQT